MRTTMLDAVTAAPSTGPWKQWRTNGHAAPLPPTVQATVSGTGAVSATVVIEVSNDGVNALTLGTITLSGTTSNSDGFAADAAWEFVRARLTAISGTGATVTAVAGF